MNAIPRPLHFCWICGNAVDLGNCNIDEHGSAVHENCYIAKIALDSKASHKREQPADPFVRSAENQRKSQELIEDTKKLLTEAQAIAKKKYRSRWA